MPEKLGQYLLRHQVISPEQLNEALQCQVIFGGRLGTNLVELGYLSLDDLTAHLARRSGFPAASVEELEELPREILGSIPRAVVEKHKVIPIRIEAKTLHCAVCDPTDLRSMDELAFSTGMRLKPYLLPELRMYFLLERHYGIKRDIRYIRLGRTMSRGKYAGAMVGGAATIAPSAPSAPTAPAGPAMPAAAELEAKGFRPLREGEELTSEAEVPVVPANGSAAPVAVVPVPAAVSAGAPEAVVRGTIDADESLPVLEPEHLEPMEPLPAAAAEAPIPYPPPASEQEAAELRHVLGTASDREEIAGAALRLVRARFAAAALFIVKGPGDPKRLGETTLLGWKGAGAALDRQSIESVMVPGSGDSVLKAPAGGVIFHGPIPSRGLNDRLLAALGRAERPASAVVVPITVKNRVVNLLYADNGAEAIPPDGAAWLNLLARDVGTAYERIILSKKKSTAEPAAR